MKGVVFSGRKSNSFISSRSEMLRLSRTHLWNLKWTWMMRGQFTCRGGESYYPQSHKLFLVVSEWANSSQQTESFISVQRLWESKNPQRILSQFSWGIKYTLNVFYIKMTPCYHNSVYRKIDIELLCHSKIF